MIDRPSNSESLCLPQSPSDLRQYLTAFPSAAPKSGPVRKGGGNNLAEEVLCMSFAREIGLPVPEVLAYPGDPYYREPWKMPNPLDPCDPRDVWYICMREVGGVPLSSIIEQLSPSTLASIGANLKDLLHRISEIKSEFVCSVTKEPLRTLLVAENHQPTQLLTAREFHHLFRELLASCFCWTSDYGRARAESWLSAIPSDDEICFTHGDLLPKNIMVDPKDNYRITSILDWENSGFYPSFWEYSRMHDPSFMTPGWSTILDCVFEGERRQDQIYAVHGMLNHFYDCL